MATFEDYAEKYQTVRMERRDGILQITFHTNGRPPPLGRSAPPRVPRGLPGHRQRP